MEAQVEHYIAQKEMSNSSRFECIDAHTAGNPVRLVKGPRPNLQGQNMMEKRLHFIKAFDWIRKRPNV